MSLRERVPVDVVGQRIRKTLVAVALLACAGLVQTLVRDPALGGWWDAFTWPELFLFGPILFFSGAIAWQFACLVAGLCHRRARGGSEDLKPKACQDTERTLRFWLRRSLGVCALYVATCAIGDIPMAVNYVAAIRGRRLHWSWSEAVISCLFLMIAVWWIFTRTVARRDL